MGHYYSYLSDGKRLLFTTSNEALFRQIDSVVKALIDAEKFRNMTELQRCNFVKTAEEEQEEAAE